MASANGNGNGHADRLPPHNLTAEIGVIGSVLLDNGRLSDVRRFVSWSHFWRDTNQIVFKAVCELADQGVPVDLVTLADELSRREQLEKIGGMDSLADLLTSVPHASNAIEYAGIVREHARRRASIEAANEMLESAYSQTKTSDQLLSLAQDRLSSLDVLEDESDPFLGVRPWPEAPGSEVFRGIAGEIVKMIAPHSESDPMAILGQVLVCFGNLIGRHAHWRVEATRHYSNLFLCIVGNSSKARKGTSWDHVAWLMAKLDETWSRDCIQGGLSTGEGLVWCVRDRIWKREKVGGIKALGGGGYQEVEVDPGVTDKRALFLETEFDSLLAKMGREGNTLSGVLRQAWESGMLRSSTKNNAARATDAHISVIAHVTAAALHRGLTQCDMANGFANRFVWLCARRSQYLPHGGEIWKVNFTEIVNQFREVVRWIGEEFTDDDAPITRDVGANQLWEEVYPRLSEPAMGLLGAVTSRAEAQCMRLAALYALLDCSKYVRRHHLESALGFWRYCEQSAAYVFGDAIGDPDAERLLTALREADSGMTSTEIYRRVFKGHKKSGEIADKLRLLARDGQVEMVRDMATRKPSVRWTAVKHKGAVR
jgi:hypothetical protein